MRAPTLFLVALVALPAILPGCSLDPARPTVEETPQPTDMLGRPAYASLSLQRELGLRERLQEVTRDVRGMVQTVKDDLQAELDQLTVPPRLVTREPFLRELRRPEVQAYEQAVADAFARALARLDALNDAAMAEVVAMAGAMAPDRSPLDAGPTGDVSLDRQVAAFEDTLRLEIGRTELEAEGYRRAVQRVEQVEIFTSFNTPDADEALGGRLLVFVGGAENERPRCDVVLRVAEDVDPADRGLLQLLRLRVMVGDTIVRDLGWLPVPGPDGLMGVSVQDRYLVAPDMSPDMQALVGVIDEVAERRVVADFQTAVFDRSRRVLGAADWRLEFRVSRRLDPSWQVSAVKPRFNPDPAEAKAFLAR